MNSVGGAGKEDTGLLERKSCAAEVLGKQAQSGCEERHGACDHSAGMGRTTWSSSVRRHRLHSGALQSELDYTIKINEALEDFNE